MNSPEVRSCIEDAHGELRKLYKGIDRCFSSMESMHLTLVGAHIPPALMAQCGDALASFRAAPLTVGFRGLGAWVTEGGRWCLFLELDSESREQLSRLACALSEHLRASVNADEQGYVSDDGGWFDVVSEDIYQPHLTILMLDPDEDKDIIAQCEAKSGRKQSSGKKLSARQKAQSSGRREKVMNFQAEQEETFGKEFLVFRNERKLYKRFDFGRQNVTEVNLESEFVVKASLNLL